ncbi:hypothetical protein AVEN_42434-1 [Araneus ventricosus]|uniref:Uncharacterized protein n=1 Tax=Araneus ventricosus TaxID=182803 RepID=A0A4Y2U5I1_ARAVE|nr:hypothetical protein AVEN_42434-1 [Araneus ventricosus]
MGRFLQLSSMVVLIVPSSEGERDSICSAFGTFSVGGKAHLVKIKFFSNSFWNLYKEDRPLRGVNAAYVEITSGFFLIVGCLLFTILYPLHSPAWFVLNSSFQPAGVSVATMKNRQNL